MKREYVYERQRKNFYKWVAKYHPDEINPLKKVIDNITCPDIDDNLNTTWKIIGTHERYTRQSTGSAYDFDTYSNGYPSFRASRSIMLSEWNKHHYSYKIRLKNLCGFFNDNKKYYSLAKLKLSENLDYLWYLENKVKLNSIKYICDLDNDRKNILKELKKYPYNKWCFLRDKYTTLIHKCENIKRELDYNTKRIKIYKEKKTIELISFTQASRKINKRKVIA